MTKLKSLLALALTAVMATAGMVLVAAPAAAETTQPCVSGVSDKLPVILVHGLGSSGKTWGSANDGNSMLGMLSHTDGLYVDAFDYSAHNQVWVDDQNIGPALAKRIACVAAASRAGGGYGKVVVIGHSMGGLAARYASSLTINGRKVSDDMGLVITIGTPNTGSGWANIHYFLSEMCPHVQWGPAADNNPCALTALEGLASQSDRLAKLPWLPSSVPVLALAGNVTITTNLFHLTIKNTLSDLVVSNKSALEYGSETRFPFSGYSNASCEMSIRTVQLWPSQPQPPAELLPNCWHSALTHNSTIMQNVVRALTSFRQQNQGARLVGTWTDGGNPPQVTLKITSSTRGTLDYLNLWGDPGSTHRLHYGLVLKPNGNGLVATTSAMGCFVGPADNPYPTTPSTVCNNGGPVNFPPNGSTVNLNLVGGNKIQVVWNSSAWTGPPATLSKN